MISTINKTAKSGPDPLGLFGSGLAEKLKTWGISAQSAMLVRALHELLDGQDEASRQLRMDVQIHLARASNSNAGKTKKIAQPAQEMLSTEAAALLMGCSRPYVAMLVDRKRLPGAIKSTGGHRKIPRSAVLAWIADSPSSTAQAADYKSAADEAGMYEIPEKTYLKVLSKKRKRAKGA